MADCSKFTIKREIFTKAIYKLKRKYRSTSPLIYILVCVFGIGSWVAINGIWAQLPILLITQPECYRLATILSVIIQVANVGPLLYTLTKLIWSACRLPTFYLEVGSVYTMLCIGLVASILLSLFWHKAGIIGGETHSIILVVLTFFLALVDCTSSVVFVPFMKHFPPIYLSALYIGEGLSGVIPSSLALIQGSVNNSIYCNPGTENYNGIEELGVRFSPSVFYLMLSGLLLACGLAFTGLLIIPLIKRVRAGRGSVQFLTSQEGEEDSRCSKCINCDQDYDPLLIEEETREEESDNSDTIKEEEREEQEGERESVSIKEPKVNQMIIETPCSSSNNKSRSSLNEFLTVIWQQRTPLTCILLIGFITNGSLNSIAPFAFGHYGNTIIHLAINLGLLANPIGAFLYALVSIKSRLLVAIFTSIISILSLYIMVHSMLDDNMILPGIAGGIIIVSVVGTIMCIQ